MSPGVLVTESFAALLDRVASTDPTPGAGPAAAWTCALAAALVEMASGVARRQSPGAPGPERARALRARALELAGEDAAAYGRVVEALRRRGEPGHPGRLRAALSDAADPPVAIAEIAAEVVSLAVELAGVARGGVRGEILTAATLAESVARAVVPVVDLNLAGDRDDPRRARAAALAVDAAAGLDRVVRAVAPS